MHPWNATYTKAHESPHLHPILHPALLPWSHGLLSPHMPSYCMATTYRGFEALFPWHWRLPGTSNCDGSKIFWNPLTWPIIRLSPFKYNPIWAFSTPLSLYVFLSLMPFLAFCQVYYAPPHLANTRSFYHPQATQNTFVMSKTTRRTLYGFGFTLDIVLCHIAVVGNHT